MQSCGFAVAVARAGAGDDMRQPQLSAGEVDVDELILWQLELSHHRLSVRAAKAQPFLLGATLAWEQFHIAARTRPAKPTVPTTFTVLNTIHVFSHAFQWRKTSRRSLQGFLWD
jgi:hypothetical protein